LSLSRNYSHFELVKMLICSKIIVLEIIAYVRNYKNNEPTDAPYHETRLGGLTNISGLAGAD
jgi:hypothetical protein